MKKCAIRTQAGLTMYGIMFFILIGGIFVTAALKLGPVYIDNNNVQTMMESIQRSYSSKDLGDISNREIIKTIKKHFQVNRIETVPYDSIDIKRKNRDVILSINYEARVPFMGNLDLVAKFENEVNLRERPE
jgi:hypothetical protein